tara:strand:- start:552 stop:1214 length:663 start_codon:yes stop_codon:yes gene_type:complete
MEIIIKNINGEYKATISVKVLEPFPKILEKFNLVKEQYEANIFAINEIINAHELAEFKLNFEKININYLHIYSNNRETILSGKSLKIDSTFVKEKDLKNKIFLNSSEKQDDILHKGTVRSGDRLSSNGNLFIIGDVNPGAIVSAKKNVYVWGKLLGIAFAGEGGNKNAYIASLYLNPLQLRINEVVAIGPKDKPKDYYPEIAILEKQSIIIKPYLIDSSK